MVLEELAGRMRARFTRHRTGAGVAEGRPVPGGPRLVLAAPQTYMNESGRPVGQLLRFYSLPPERVIVVHDELDLPFGALRLKSGGGHGGHNRVPHIPAGVRAPPLPPGRGGRRPPP